MIVMHMGSDNQRPSYSGRHGCCRVYRLHIINILMRIAVGAAWQVAMALYDCQHGLEVYNIWLLYGRVITVINIMP